MQSGIWTSSPPIKRWVPVVTLPLVLFWASAAHSQADQHGVHHPSNVNSQTARPSPAPTGKLMPSMSPSPGAMMEDENDMERMMERRSPPKELYPSLMDLPNLSSERRFEIERLAHERMEAGRASMSAASERLSSASVREDYAAMQEASAQLREALSQYESGLAAHRALAEGKAPRNIALLWFKRELNLLPPMTEPATSLFGLPSRWFHYFVIAILSIFAVSMIWMYFHKMRRAEILLAQLAQGSINNNENEAHESVRPAIRK